MNLHDRDIIRATRKEVTLQKTIEAARNFYANGASIDLISKSLNLTVEQVKEIVSDVETVQA